MVELTPLLTERAGAIWGPLGKEAVADLSRMSVDELKSVIEYHRTGRDLNERHVERVRQLSFD